jgi:HD-like signal output (HDOD) protein
MANSPAAVEYWTHFLGEKEIPVLRQTAQALTDAQERIERITARGVATIVQRDPMMSLRVLRFAMRRRSKRQLQEISTVERAVMMFGVEPFFHHFAQFDVVEEQLKPHPQALLGLLHVVRRAQRAARYALDWATWRCDLNSEEVAVAAILHDLAEVLMWCFAPQQSLRILALRDANPTMHSADAQTAVLGFTLNELQNALCQSWQLPELLSSLMDEAHADRPRVKNVKLAVDLARHSARGWDDPALPDDFAAIARLMNIDHDTLMLRLGLQGTDAAHAFRTRSGV